MTSCSQKETTTGRSTLGCSNALPPEPVVPIWTGQWQMALDAYSATPNRSSG